VLFGNHWSTAGQWRERHATPRSSGGSPRDFPAKIPAHNPDKGLYLLTGRRRMPILVTGTPTSRKSKPVRSRASYRHPTDRIVTCLFTPPVFQHEWSPHPARPVTAAAALRFLTDNWQTETVVSDIRPEKSSLEAFVSSWKSWNRFPNR